MSPPFKDTEVDLMFGKGISKEADIIDLGVVHDVVAKTGSWYSYGEEKLGQGKAAVTKLLEDTPTLYDELRIKILEKIGFILPAAPATEEAPVEMPKTKSKKKS